MNRIGVWNTAFLGDAVLTLPLIATLKAAFPESEIHYFVRKGLEPLFAAQPELAAVHGYDKRGADKGLSAAFRLGRKLAHEGFGLWVSAHTSLRSGLIARWTSAPIRIGYARPFYNCFLYTYVVRRRFKQHDEIERLLRLAAPLRPQKLLTWPELVLNEAAENRAETLFKAHAAPHAAPIVGLHPGSVWATKRWPESGCSELANLLAARGIRLALFAGPGEEGTAATVFEGMDERAREACLDLSGKLSLPELAACLKRLDCYVTNDSGPMHLAWCQRTPVVAFFGPTVRELGFFPRGKSVVLEADVACRPCSLHGPSRCPEEHHRCMRDITPQTAFEAVLRQLEEGRA